MSRTTKRNWCILFAVGACAVIAGFLGILFRIVIPMRAKAPDIGTNLGSYWGEVIGRAVGTRDLEEGSDAENAAVAADDDAAVEQFMENVGTEELQVFSADVREPLYYQTLTEKGNIQYAAMKIIVGQAYYSVDMGQAEVAVEGDSVTITLPQPTAELKDGEITDTEPAAEYKRIFSNGSAVDGINDFNAVIAEAQNNMTRKLSEDEFLVNLAREAAERQVTSLARAAFGTGVSINIEFAQ